MFSDLPQHQRQAAGGRQTLRKLVNSADADPGTLNVTLFRDADDIPRGWFIGPLVIVDGHPTLPYLPRSEKTSAAVAVVRAIKVARSAGCPLCVIDPGDLWDIVWRA